MINLSVNVNKVATLRNSRGGTRPSVEWAVSTCIAAGAQGITVHPRADRRHITPEDVRSVAAQLGEHPGVEYNIEGDPRQEWMELVLEVHPTQATLVPVSPGEITSDHGYRFADDRKALEKPVERLRAAGIRVSAFVDAGVGDLEIAKGLGIDRIELYTGPFAEAYERGGEREAKAIWDSLVETAARASAVGLGINAGHDLDLENLRLMRQLPGLDEVSIGHALIADALEMGLAKAVKAYLAALKAE
jgi:pyridoxine 5-phosphate synthase